MLTPFPGCDPQSFASRPRVDLVLRGTGGAGRSLAFLRLTQFRRGRQSPRQCVDPDSVRRSLAQVKALDVRVFDRICNGSVDSGIHNELLASLLNPQCSIVVNFRVATFPAVTHCLGELAEARPMPGEARRHGGHHGPRVGHCDGQPQRMRAASMRP
jgi:hypothetical protein